MSNTLTIRNLEDEVKARLRVVAAEHGRSMEEEARVILREALTRSRPVRGLGSRIHRRFAPAEIQEFELPDRTDPPRSPSEWS